MECTATVLMPNSLQARKRGGRFRLGWRWHFFAWGISFWVPTQASGNRNQRLIKLDGFAVLNMNRRYGAGAIGSIWSSSRLTMQYVADQRARFHKGGRIRARRTIKRLTMGDSTALSVAGSGGRCRLTGPSQRRGCRGGGGCRGRRIGHGAAG